MMIMDIMTSAPVCCRPDTRLNEVAKLMLEHDCGAIPVCGGTRIAGIVTDRDITCRALARGKNPFEVPVRDIMTTDVFTVTETDDVDKALHLMETRQVRRIPVMRGGEVVGIVSLADLATTLPGPKVAELLESVSKRLHATTAR